MKHTYLRRCMEFAAFDTEKATKSDLFSGDQMMVGLNCFESGQSQRIHAHGGADKFYLLLSGRANMVVGEDTFTAETGDLIWAPADVAHGVAEALERTVMLIGLAPPPRRG